MDWKKLALESRTKNGFILIIEEGTFQVPYEISIQPREGLSLSAHDVDKSIVGQAFGLIIYSINLERRCSHDGSVVYRSHPEFFAPVLNPG
ncbi:hypothetical protein A3194_12330 [Candidatus Thiodiazotropha endoloripes]|uniref:hypothetical protein n=1 Tax=Candidatus Thiodiazotropha endoloripes TaxID=1818881 RepID=UPI00083E4497|nr:hypothetical protein [Candidatus Thiodiazotropha endoloripes]ODB85615.1 hypothetical protein A3194_12330 [Candidatus Thiodiazotropha endoloripes]